MFLKLLGIAWAISVVAAVLTLIFCWEDEPKCPDCGQYMSECYRTKCNKRRG